MKPGYWQGRRVFLTGHTGFKGSWLTVLLKLLGAEVHGYALPPTTQPSLYEDGGLDSIIDSRIGDIRDSDSLTHALQDARPEIVLHLAAQAIVSESFAEPLATLQTNIIGTANLLQAACSVSSVKAVVVVTSDKCYNNNETGHAYREDAALGGKDPYSASKACTEIVTAAWRWSFSSKTGQPTIATARAGNVIGGGDWSRDRLIPDMIRAFMRNEPALIRSPASVRPWQHVLEPLIGYLILAERCATDSSFGQAWNFGPDQQDARSVHEVADSLVRLWGDPAGWHQQGANPVKEATILNLDSSKAQALLQWRPCTGIDEGLQLTCAWYKRFAAGENALELTREQTQRYLEARL